MHDNSLTLKCESGPTIHLLVERERIGELIAGLDKELHTHLQETLDHMKARLESSVTDAYRVGLQDGFAQGAMAESRNQDDAG